MEKENTLRMNLSAPNFISVCIDEAANGELGGRMYHYYKEEPARFGSVLELLGLAEKLYDGIAFPQASTMSRSFGKQEGEQPPYNRPRPGKLTGVRELTGQRGRLSTVLVRVDYRQNSTWQGEALWVEQGEKKSFQNELELVGLLEKSVTGV